MNYKFIILLLFAFIVSCVQQNSKNDYNKTFDIYSNKGFTLIYNESLFKKKILKKKIDNRSLTVISNKLSKDTPVKITNLLNGKDLIAKIVTNSQYPIFYNSVISDRIAKDLEINPLEPYIKIESINSNNTFIANKAKTFKEEKNVANKAPVENIEIKNISISKKNKKNNKINKIGKFSYIIKFADLYFENSAILLKKRLNDEFNVKNVSIKKLSENTYRVYIGPFNNLESIKKEFNYINKLNFENIEFVKL